MRKPPDNRRTNTQFQSAPGREAGRCNSMLQQGQVMIGFNPRPAVRPGDAS